MEYTEKLKLIDAYRRYGFVQVRERVYEDILVFTLKTGYFDNAEIVKLVPSASTEAAFSDLTAAGFACTVRTASTPEEAETELFKGFFSADVTRRRLLDEYNRFAKSLVLPYGPTAEYSYIKAPYQLNGKEGVLSPPEEVMKLIDEPGPILFLIEAAAGFGKTCTALELVKLLAGESSRIPLYAELSRNRQARIFRYILLDEIDRTFPLLSSSLVQTEIKNGKVAAILDGFDELLKKGEESGAFESKEPMLETVSELLSGRAKIIITTRRTALFDGDDFHQWLDRHAEAFRVVRIRIQEPRVADWLPSGRLQALEAAGLKIDAMANPVLLSYLRCIDEEHFGKAVGNPESIVESYFTYMLDRERERQDLRMSVSTQLQVLKSITSDMMKSGYTAEQREYLVNCILITSSKLIDETRAQYPATERPTREEIANKLASHALLDRSNQDPNKIGFVNEFALGNFVALNILSISEWMGDDPRFLDPAVRSYAPRTEATRSSLYSQLASSLPFLDVSARIEIATQLQHRLPDVIENDEAEGLTLDGVAIGEISIRNFQFNECIFKNCIFVCDTLDEVTFLNCRFYDCTVNSSEAGGSVYVLGSISSPDINAALSRSEKAGNLPSVDPLQIALRLILKKFWPIGEPFFQRPSRPVFKPVKYLCRPTEGVSVPDLFEAIDQLKKMNFIDSSKSNLICLNMEKLDEIQIFLSDI